MKVRAFNLSMTGVVTRFYAMMLTAILLGFLGASWVLISFVAVGFAFTTILGASFELSNTISETKSTTSTSLTSIRGSKTIRRVG